MMRKTLFNLFLVLILSFSFVVPIIAQERYASCDQCGFCPPNPPPGNWRQCVQCLYEGINPNPESRETLRIDPETNLPVSPIPGRAYTIIGCIKTTDLTSFEQEGAAASLVQKLLDIIFRILGGVALIYLLYGASIIMTSQANPERINYGKRIIMGSIIGVIFAVSAVFLVNFIASGILKIPGFGG
jgi:hypothetical protein